MRPTRLAGAMVVVTLGAVAGAAGGAGAGAVSTVSSTFSDTVDVIKDEVVTTSELAVRLSEATPSVVGSTRTVVARDDVFADSMSSGVLQGDSPLLLVPSDGPLPARVVDALAGIGSSEVVLLGGTAAISPAVEAQLAGLGLATQRRAGADRVATAVEIARAEVPDAATAILTRAFGSSTTDPSQAFADSLAVGGWSADTGWPVLLTASAALSPDTAAYLASSTVTRVEIVGGTAAIGPAVEQALIDMGMQVDRTAGTNRFATAVEVAGKRGADTAADVDRVTLVEGQAADAWAGGFAAAAHSAAFDAPIVLTNGDTVPPETAAFLDGTGFAATSRGGSGTGLALTCVTLTSSVCAEGRTLLGLPAATVAFDPPAGPVLADATVLVTVTSTEPVLVIVDGSCVSSTTPLSATGGTVVLDRGHPCDLTAQVTFPDGTVQRTTVGYDDDVPLPPAATPTPTPPVNTPIDPPIDPPTDPAPGAIEGTVVSASSGDPIQGASVQLQGGATATTGADGAYLLVADAGTHTATASAAGYVDQVREDIAVAEGQTTTTDFSLSAVIVDEDIRIVLDWAEVPRDLDSHLWLPDANPYHLFFGRRGAADVCPFALLDVDDVDGEGPETVTISEAAVGTYRYAVHNFSGESPLATSGARVRIFDRSGQLEEFQIDPEGSSAARWWHVLDLDLQSGQLEPVDLLLETSPAPYESTDSGCAVE